jgi:hypothetical protein
MGLDQSALTELLDTLRSGGDLDCMREAMQLVLPSSTLRPPRRSMLPAANAAMLAPPTATAPGPAVVDQGRRRGAGHSQAAVRQLLPRPVGAPPAHRPVTITDSELCLAAFKSLAGRSPLLSSGLIEPPI